MVGLFGHLYVCFFGDKDIPFLPPDKTFLQKNRLHFPSFYTITPNFGYF